MLFTSAIYLIKRPFFEDLGLIADRVFGQLCVGLARNLALPLLLAAPGRPGVGVACSAVTTSVEQYINERKREAGKEDKHQ